MSVWIITVKYVITREAEIKGVFSSEQTAREAFVAYRKTREDDKERMPYEEWVLHQSELDQEVKD